jgi:hypothetical protein
MTENPRLIEKEWREAIKKVACPFCDAVEGEDCENLRDRVSRKRPHRWRLEVARGTYR